MRAKKGESCIEKYIYDQSLERRYAVMCLYRYKNIGFDCRLKWQ